MGGPEFRSLVGAGVTTFGDVVLAVTFWATWLQADTAAVRPIDTLLVVMLMEFIVIHSSAMMGHVWLGEGSASDKIARLGGLGCLYLVFAAAFAASAGAWWPIVLMLALLVNRMVTVLMVPDPDAGVRKRVEAGWARTTMLYLLLAFGTTMLPVPELGISDAVVRSADLDGGGLWVDEPYRVIAFGALYFTALAVLELRAQWPRRAAVVTDGRSPLESLADTPHGPAA